MSCSSPADVLYVYSRNKIGVSSSVDGAIYGWVDDDNGVLQSVSSALVGNVVLISLDEIILRIILLVFLLFYFILLR